jgi:hypothetical protein|tara:strand:- start:810 stop:2798 length:1989 start_codon:yes stop_codon:yes gene_type:complete
MALTQEEMQQFATITVESLRRAGIGGGNTGGSPTNAANAANARSTGNFSGALKRAGDVAEGTAGFLNSAGTGVEFLAKKIGSNFSVLGDAVGGFATYLTDTQSVFQSLSKVGAGFNGDLGALRAGAAQTRMPLDMFANMVGNNATSLLGLGASVNQGAKRFSQLSAAMFDTGVIDGMMNLGYTIEEANELLLTNAAITRRQQILSGPNDKAVAEATLRMAANMAIVAEISGKSAKQQAAEMADAARDGKNIAANRRMEARGINDATTTFAQASNGLSTLGPAAQALLADFNQTGVAMTPMTRNFAVFNPRTAEAIESIQALRDSNMDSADKQVAIDAAINRARRIAAEEYTGEMNLFAGSIGTVNAQGQMVADNLAATEDARLAREKFVADARRDGDTRSVGDLNAAFFKSVSDTVGGMEGGGAENQAISRELNRATIGLANTASKYNVQIATALSQNIGLQGTITTALTGSTEVVEGLGDIIGGLTESILGFGDSVSLDVNPFKELFDPIIGNKAMNVRIVEESLDGTKSPTPADYLNIPKAIGGGVESGKSYQVGELGPETFVAGMNGAIIPNMKAMLNRMPDVANTMQEEIAALGTPMSESSRAQMAMSGNKSLEQKLDILNQTMLQLVSINSLQARTGEKHLKASRSAGNLMTGIGRA